MIKLFGSALLLAALVLLLMNIFRLNPDQVVIAVAVVMGVFGLGILVDANVKETN